MFGYYYYKIFNNFIIFYCNNIFSICIYDIRKKSYIKYITTYNNYYKLIVYEDCSLNVFTIYIIYNQFSSIHFDIHDVINDKNLNFDIKCSFELHNINLITKNCFLCDFGPSSQIIDLNAKNKLHITYLNPKIEYSNYLCGVNSTYIRTNNEFYVCPVYNQLIERGGKVRIKNINKMWGLGTPEDLNNFMSNYDGEY